MEDLDPTTESPNQAVASRPRARDWLWSPWYAKLWWGAIVAFWLTAFAIWLLAIGHLPIDAQKLLYFAIILHPQTALLLLGIGYARALFARRAEVGNEQDVSDGDDDGYPIDERIMGYLTDPSDPRSPLSSLNPASPRYINRHHR